MDSRETFRTLRRKIHGRLFEVSNVAAFFAARALRRASSIVTDRLSASNGDLKSNAKALAPRYADARAAPRPPANRAQTAIDRSARRSAKDAERTNGQPVFHFIRLVFSHRIVVVVRRNLDSRETHRAMTKRQNDSRETSDDHSGANLDSRETPRATNLRNKARSDARQ